MAQKPRGTSRIKNESVDEIQACMNTLKQFSAAFERDITPMDELITDAEKIKAQFRNGPPAEA